MKSLLSVCKLQLKEAEEEEEGEVSVNKNVSTSVNKQYANWDNTSHVEIRAPHTALKCICI